MADSFQEKTEQPTEKRLEDARKKGQVAQSKELFSCFTVLFTAIFLYYSVSHGFNEMYKVYMNYVTNINLDVNVSTIYEILSFSMFKWMRLVLPIFALLCAIALLGSVLQSGFMWNSESIKFDFEKLDPAAGIKKLFSKRSAVEILKSLLKIVVLVYISYSIITKELPDLISLPFKDIETIIEYLGKTSFRLALKVSIILSFIAGLDFLFQKWQHNKELMMTQQEVKEEYKDREGNPLIKSRIRSLQREMSRRRMIEDVKNADVIVTNPTTFAVALKYNPKEMPAPKVVAKGAGFIAQRIKEVALQHSVPLRENKPLAQALFYSVKVGSSIPEKFYLIVAELLAQVYKKKNRILL
jgi:flagellar biosynthesis protein FlhB